MKRQTIFAISMLISFAPAAVFADDWGSWDAPLSQANDLDDNFERDINLEEFAPVEDVDARERFEDRNERREFGVGLEGDDERYLSELDGSSLHDEAHWDEDHDRHRFDDEDHDDWQETRWGGAPDHEEEYWETIEHPFTAFEDEYGDDFDDDDFENGGNFEPGEFPGGDDRFNHPNVFILQVVDK